jgi:two-component system OmpR family sensor kinase
MSSPGSRTESGPAAGLGDARLHRPSSVRRWFARRLYLRLWAAVVLALVVLAMVFAWLLRSASDNLPPREVLVRDASGEIVGQASARPVRVPGQGIEFEVRMTDGSALYVQIPPRQRAQGEAPPSRPWPRGPYAMFWILALAALVVAAATYPIVRGLTKGLERLRQGVERWGEGDLSARVLVQGEDEVAFLAERFNLAAQRIEGLVRSHAALLASNRSLLANASHELRSPLARIRMALELQQGRSADASRAELDRSIEELDQLIGEILLASRLDAREADMGTVESVDLVGLAAEECARTGAELVLDEAGGGAAPATLVVPGVGKLLRRLIRNLLENARRYSRSLVTLDLGRCGDVVKLRVRDDGPGVPPALRERIFEPFFRLPGASEREGSVGLGLALVRSIAERHGGTVRCEEPGPAGGACFVVRLPLHPS